MFASVSVDHPQISRSNICSRVLHSFIRSDCSSTIRQKRTLDQTPSMLLYRASVGREVALGTKNDTFIRFHLWVPQILIVSWNFHRLMGAVYGLILVTTIQRLFVKDSMQSKRQNSLGYLHNTFSYKAICIPREPRSDPSNPRLYEHGIWYLSDNARNRTHNLVRHKCTPIPLGHSDCMSSYSLMPSDSFCADTPFTALRVWRF